MKNVGMGLAVAIIGAVVLGGAAVARDADQLPEGFSFVGNYEVEKRVKVRNGSLLPVALKRFVCRVYTDGITVRVYGDEGVEGHTELTIYRNDGVVVETGEGQFETVPGIQAQTLVGEVMRQLTLTEDSFVLTKFPAHSDVVDVTYANRLITITRIERE